MLSATVYLFIFIFSVSKLVNQYVEKMYSLSKVAVVTSTTT